MEEKIKVLEQTVSSLITRLSVLEEDVIKLQEEKTRLESVLSQHISNPSH